MTPTPPTAAERETYTIEDCIPLAAAIVEQEPLLPTIQKHLNAAFAKGVQIGRAELAAARDDDGEPADETWIKRIAHTRCNGVYVIDEFSCYHYFRFVFHREDRFKNADGSCDVMLCDPPGLEGPGITVFRGCTKRQVRDLCRIVGAPLKEPA